MGENTGVEVGGRAMGVMRLASRKLRDEGGGV